MSPDLAEAITDDAALGGRLHLLQPRKGHRFGHDAILLAAATPASAGDHVIELGAGVGAAGLAIAARVSGIRLTLIEIDSALATLAAQNIVRNGFAESAKAHCLDVTASAEAFAPVGLTAGSADCVVMNPPFHDPARTAPSPDARRRVAHVGGRDVLDAWIACARRLLRVGGALSMIYRADRIRRCLHDAVVGFRRYSDFAGPAEARRASDSGDRQCGKRRPVSAATIDWNVTQRRDWKAKPGG